MTTYEVIVSRADGMWAVIIGGLPPGVIGAIDVDRFADLDAEVREFIADLTDTEPTGFRLLWQYIVGDLDVTIELSGYAHAEAALQEAALARDAARRAALDALSGTGVSQSVIGDILGLSHQRVHQLLRAG